MANNENNNKINEFLDREGLKKFLQEIDRIYVRKSAIEEVLEIQDTLEGLQDQLDHDGLDQSSIKASLVTLKGLIDQEILDRGTRDTALTEDINILQGNIDTLNTDLLADIDALNADLSADISAVDDRVTEVVSDLQSEIQNAVSAAETSLQAEISAGDSALNDQIIAVDEDLSAVSSRLEAFINSLDLDSLKLEVSEALVPVIHEATQDIGSGVVFIEDGEPMPGAPGSDKIPDEALLYITQMDHKVLQWDGEHWITLGEDVQQTIDDLVIQTTNLETGLSTVESEVSGLSAAVEGLEADVQEVIEDGGAVTAQLRQDFEEFQSSTEESLGTIGETLGAVTAKVEDLPDMSSISVSLASKVDKTSIADNLTTQDSEYVLAAPQGAILASRIVEATNKITSLGNVFHFKGLVPTKADLNLKTATAQVGDCWQVETTDQTDGGKVFAYTEKTVDEEIISEWVEVSATIADFSAIIATADEVYDIINNYEENN